MQFGKGMTQNPLLQKYHPYLIIQHPIEQNIPVSALREVLCE